MRFSELFLEYWPLLLQGFGMTLLVVSLSITIGFSLSVPLALAIQARPVWLRVPCAAFIFFFRGTPLLVQMFIVYYGFSQFQTVKDSILWGGFLESPFWCGVIALSLNAAAYMAVILRGGMRAVPSGQIEAARAFAMPPRLRLRRVILPLAFRAALPNYSNEFILLIKGSALTSTITLMELTGVARTLIAQTYEPIDFYIMAAVLYLVLNLIVAQVFRRLERLLSPWRTSQAYMPQSGSAPTMTVTGTVTGWPMLIPVQGKSAVASAALAPVARKR
jgi:putative lysine/arginine/ornithine/histidine/octopine transport system permease protein